MSAAAKSCARCGATLSVASAVDVCPACLAPQVLAPENASGVKPSGTEPSPAATRYFPGSAEVPGDTIGRYKLREKIGEGGYGVVYVAEQEDPVRRRVALKVIKLGMDTRAVVARFEAERQALAMMDHPNIARVLDAGTTGTGRPFFVMELVRGICITQYCDKNKLNTRRRLELFSQVCNSVQHAHQKGVIHRDLKPSNILVTLHDGVPVPKVIDFGIAKATEGRLTDKTIYTELHQFIGTPAYMSPEQAEMSGLDIDTRSDIYSLGVLLYELLTGSTPFDPQELAQRGLEEVRRTIREIEPPRPSTRLSTLAHADLDTVAQARGTESLKLPLLLRGDLDWIVMKALEKDRTRRYETANGFAADIQRHLRNEPVVARPPSRFYACRKMIRRNRVAFSAAAAVLAALLAGLGFSTWALVREREARMAAATEASKSRQVSKFLKDMIWNLKPSVAMGRDTTLLREFADQTLDRLNQDLAGQPEVELELRATLGGVFHTLEDHRKAEALYRESLPRMKATLGNEHEQVAHVLQDFACVLNDRGKYKEAEALARESLTLETRLYGPEHPKVAESLRLIATALGQQKKYKDAEMLHRESLDLCRKLHGPEHRDIATTMNGLALNLDDQGRSAEAEGLFRESLAMRKRLYKTAHPSVIQSTENFARFHVRRGNLAEAATLWRELLTLQRSVLGNENRQVADTLANLAGTLIDHGNPAEGEPIARESLALRRRLYGEDSVEAVMAGHDLAIALGRLDRQAEAEPLLRHAVTIMRKVLAPDSNRRSKVLYSLALNLDAQKKLAEAEAAFRELVELAREKANAEPRKIEDRLADLADTLYRQDKFAEAEPVYLELIQSRSRRKRADHEDVFGPKASLARLLADWAWADRTNAVTGAVSRPEATPESRGPKSEIDQSLVTSIEKSPFERAREAERLLLQSLEFRLKSTNISHWRIGDMRSRLGGAILSVAVTDPTLAPDSRQARFAEAEALLRKGNDGIPPDKSSARTHKRDALERLVRLYEGWNKPAQASEWRVKVADFNKSNGANEAAPKDDSDSVP